MVNMETTNEEYKSEEESDAEICKDDKNSEGISYVNGRSHQQYSQISQNYSTEKVSTPNWL